MKPLLCRVGLHNFEFRRPTYFGSGALEICKRCGKGRILHFAGFYEYADAQAIEARRAETRSGSVEDESAVGNADAPTTSPTPGDQSHG